tara:strand:+ start:4521 stop:5783 length:1263 start_codon:yes stop_codon:yes gene_type:complete
MQNEVPDSVVQEILGGESRSPDGPRLRPEYDDSMDRVAQKDPLTASLAFQSMRAHLPIVAEMLGTSVDNLFLLEEIQCRSHMKESYRDRLIEQKGLIDFPFVRDYEGSNRNGPRYSTGTGLQLYEIKGDDLTSRKYRYVFATIPTSRGNHQFAIAKKGEVAHLIRYFKRMRIKSLRAVPPILHEGILDDLMRNSVNFLRSDADVKKYGVKVKRGLVLSGDPGNGKTMTCRYIREMAAIHDIEVSTIRAGELEDAYANGNLDYVLNREGIIFLDDIDVSFFNREGDGRMACALLAALDGMQETGRCVRIFTTNEKIEGMDRAFKRPGRIDRVFSFEKPNPEMRLKLFQTWPEEIRNAVEEDTFVAKTDSFSFAECEAIRTIMVTNHVIKQDPWDFDAALRDYGERTGESFVQRRVGFGADS